MYLQNNLLQSPRYRRYALIVGLICILSVNLGIIFFTQDIQSGMRLLLLVLIFMAQLLAFALGRFVRVTSEQARTSSGEPLDQAEQVQVRPGQSIVNITHELRTPVSLIVGFCETIISPARA